MKNKPTRTPPKSDFECAIDLIKDVNMRIMIKDRLHDLESTKREKAKLEKQ